MSILLAKHNPNIPEGYVSKDEKKPKETETKQDAPVEFIPRKLKLVTQSARGMYLCDAETGEDLRLPLMSITADPVGEGQANVHTSFRVVAVEMEKR